MLDRVSDTLLIALLAADTALSNNPLTALMPEETMLFMLSTKPVMELMALEICDFRLSHTVQMLLFIEENAVTAVDLMLPQVVERVVLRPPHTVFVLVLTLFHTFAMDVLMLLNTELAVDFTEFQAVESEDLMLLHFVEVSVLIFDHVVLIVDFRLLQVVLASVLTLPQVVESEVLMFVHAVEVLVLTLSHAVEMVVFMLFQTVLAVDLIPSQVVERKLLMLPHTVEAVLLMAFQASEQACLIPSNFSEKNSTMLCQVSAIPCRRPSIRKVPISANTVEGE